MRKNECEPEYQFFSLDLIFELILTPEPLLDFNEFPESELVHVPSELKSFISSYYIPFWDKGVDKNNSEIIFQR